MNLREKGIADQELESEMKKGKDAPTPILRPQKAIIFKTFERVSFSITVIHDDFFFILFFLNILFEPKGKLATANAGPGKPKR